MPYLWNVVSVEADLAHGQDLKQDQRRSKQNIQVPQAEFQETHEGTHFLLSQTPTNTTRLRK